MTDGMITQLLDGCWNHAALTAEPRRNRDGGDLIVDFPGLGLWVLHTGSFTWTLHPYDVSVLVTADLNGNGTKDVVMASPATACGAIESVSVGR
jgi:hypothetical protein